MSATKKKAERTAADAWDYLSSAMAAASDTAGRAASVAGDKSQDLAGKGQGLAGEAWARANAAAAALAGNRPRRPWGLIALAGVAGLAVGLLAAGAARRAIARDAEAEERELADTGVIITPTPETGR
jgi:hypothetical protein